MDNALKSTIIHGIELVGVLTLGIAIALVLQKVFGVSEAIIAPIITGVAGITVKALRAFDSGIPDYVNPNK